MLLFQAWDINPISLNFFPSVCTFHLYSHKGAEFRVRLPPLNPLNLFSLLLVKIKAWGWIPPFSFLPISHSRFCKLYWSGSRYFGKDTSIPATLSPNLHIHSYFWFRSQREDASAVGPTFLSSYFPLTSFCNLYWSGSRYFSKDTSTPTTLSLNPASNFAFKSHLKAIQTKPRRLKQRKIFDTLLEALCWILQNNYAIPYLILLLEDFLIISPSRFPPAAIHRPKSLLS